MQKTKIGIPVGIMSAAIFFVAIAGNFIPYGRFTLVIFLAGYVLLSEEDDWLRKNAVKALVLMIAFFFFFTALSLINSIVSLIIDIFAMITRVNIEISFFYEIIYLIKKVIGYGEMALFAVLGVLSFNNGTISIPFVDKLVEKHTK